MSKILKHLEDRKKTNDLLISILETHRNDSVDFKFDISAMCRTVSEVLPESFAEHVEQLDKELFNVEREVEQVSHFTNYECANRVHGLNIVLFSLGDVTPLAIDLYYKNFISKCFKYFTAEQLNECKKLQKDLKERLFKYRIRYVDGGFDLSSSELRRHRVGSLVTQDYHNLGERGLLEEITEDVEKCVELFQHSIS